MAIGMMASSSRLSWQAVILPDGIGRHGLLTESSTMECGRRWFARSKMSTLIQTQSTTRGTCLRMLIASGDWFVVIIGPARALQIPNADSGKTLDLRSFRVPSQIVRKSSRTWCIWLRRSCYLSSGFIATICLFVTLRSWNLWGMSMSSNDIYIGRLGTPASSQEQSGIIPDRFRPRSYLPW